MSIVWGNVAEWVGALGTAGAFWAAGAVYVSDRRRQRRDLIDPVIVSSELIRTRHGDGSESHELSAVVYNAGSQPLVEFSVTGPNPDRLGRMVNDHPLHGMGSGDPSDPIFLHSDSRAHFQQTFKTRPEPRDFVVTIIDGRRRVWYVPLWGEEKKPLRRGQLRRIKRRWKRHAKAKETIPTT